MAQTDKFGQHEVLHMASVISDLFEREIAEHGAVKADPELKRAAAQVAGTLASFYQLLGSNLPYVRES